MDGKECIALPDAETNKRIGSRLKTIGFLLTVAYVAGIVIYWFGDGSALLTLEPNEFGDFLAGVFAPLAFLWLVLGFLQQGHELRNSADALGIQSRELQNSVAQQRELVNVTREQLAFESEMLTQQREEIIRNSRPILKLFQGGSYGEGDGKRRYKFLLANHGKPCTAVSIFRNELERPIGGKDSLASGDRFEFTQLLPIGEIKPFDLTVRYVDERLLPGAKEFRVSYNNSRFEIEELPDGAVEQR